MRLVKPRMPGGNFIAIEMFCEVAKVDEPLGRCIKAVGLLSDHLPFSYMHIILFLTGVVVDDTFAWRIRFPTSSRDDRLNFSHIG